MNIQQKMPTTPDEFLRWNEGREGKREFVNGRVVEMMINVSRNHVRLATNLLLALGRRLDPDQFDIGSADFGVRTPEGIRYPDVFVDRIEPGSSGTDLSATAPALVAEVLSPSSVSRDFIVKLADYRGIPSLLYYLILSHEDARAWLWSSQSGEWSGPQEIAGEDDSIPLPGLLTELPLAEIYAGLRRH